jgi:hypothetical protein
MALAAFDTHDFVKRLTSAGLAVEVAEVFAKEQSLLIGTIVSKDDLKEHKAANKSDAEHLEERIDSKFDLLRKDIDTKFAGMDAKLEKAKFDLLRWMVGLAIGNFAFLVGILWKVMSIPIPSVTH